MWWRAFRTAPAEVCNRAMREVFTVGFVSLLPLLLGILIANISFFKAHPFTLYDSLSIFAVFTQWPTFLFRYVLCWIDHLRRL
jgi:hypothetical protein